MIRNSCAGVHGGPYKTTALPRTRLTLTSRTPGTALIAAATRSRQALVFIPAMVSMSVLSMTRRGLVIGHRSRDAFPTSGVAEIVSNRSAGLQMLRASGQWVGVARLVVSSTM